MLSVLAVALLSQAPAVSVTHDVAVVTTSRSDEAARAHVERALASARTALREAGLQVQSEAETQQRLGGQGPEECRQNFACFALLGRSLGVTIMVKVDASVVETDLAISAQAIATAQPSVLAELSTLTSTIAGEAEMAALIAPFAAEVKAAAPKREPAVSSLTPNVSGPSETPGVVQPAPASGSSRLTAALPAGLGAASLVVGGLLLNDARAVHVRFTSAGSETPIGAEEGQALVARGGRSQTLGAIFTGLGVAGLAAGAVLFFTAGEPSTGANVTVGLTPSGAVAAGSF